MAGASSGLSLRIQKQREAKARLAAIEPKMREAIADAVEDTAKATAYGEAARLSKGRGVRFGFLKKVVTFKFSAKTLSAKVGLSDSVYWLHLPNGKMLRYVPAKIGRLVEFGHKDARAFPFVMPEAESQRVYYAQRLKANLAQSARDLSVSRGV